MDQKDTFRIRHRCTHGLRQAIAWSAVLASTLSCGRAAEATTLDWVTVGNPGNANDSTGYGAVGYTYRIGTYEVTNGQYAAFLNAVAKTDTYGLYSTNMATFTYGPHPRWGIGRTWNSDGYSYSPLPGSADMPVGWLTWFNAVRFTNWVANGQPTGTQSGSTTENGAYALNGLMSGTGVARNSVNPNTGLAPLAFIPTENEWYKAAYYSPVLNSGSGGYYLYATQSNIAPGNSIGSAPNQANYIAVVNGTGVYAVTQSPSQDYYQTYYTNVGTFAGSASYYGTFDQTGNQLEMVDAVRSGSRLMTRGGDWLTGAEWSKSTFRGDGFSPEIGYLNNGFRLAMVNTIGTVASGSVAVGAGGFADIPTATGGVINASAGTAVVGTLAGATLSTGAGGATVTTLISGTVITSGGSISTQGGTFTGSITGNGGLTMTGTGTLVLSSANSYTGNTVINAGTVQITVGDAIGPAPIRIANNGRFRAMGGVAVANTVVVTTPAATYEHVLSGTDSLANLAPVSNTITTADIVAGDSAATTVTSNFNGNGSLTLHGLDGTRFLMVLDMDGGIPDDATTADFYLGWWNEAANGGTGAWVNAVLGNHGSAGSLAAAYTTGYQQFLTSHGGWNGTTMLGAYGLDLANDQVWAVIDHNSDFGVTHNGILVVTEPATAMLAISAATVARWWPRRRTKKAS